MRNLRLAWLHLRIGVMNEMQYRANFFIQLIQSMVAVATGLIVLGLIFSRTTELNGWTRPQLLVVMGVFTFVGGFIRFAVQPNMNRIMADIEKGTFDYVLTKPVDSQLLGSVRQFGVWSLTDCLVGLGVVIWGLVSLDRHIDAGEFVAFFVTMCAGSVVLYCLWLIPTAAAFWLTRVDFVQDLFDGFYRAGQYPTTVYPGWLRLTMSYLVPIGLAVTVPSQALTGRLTVTRLLVTVGFVAAAVIVSRIVWRTGSRRYSGASA